MPTIYKCDNCNVTAESLDGWYMIQLAFSYVQPNAPPPGGRMLESTPSDLMFHVLECRDAWCAKAGLVVPAPVART